MLNLPRQRNGNSAERHPWATGKEVAMHDVIYAMRFVGRAEPVGTDGNVLKAATSAPSSRLTSRVGPSGLDSALEPASGEAARFISEVTFTGETSFQETGTITFGAGNSLRFSTVGSGYLAPSADATRKHGTVMWRVDSGEGQFAGASGLITSNFFVDEGLGVVDHHFGVLLLP
jgi:hypothetical protein